MLLDSTETTTAVAEEENPVVLWCFWQNISGLIEPGAWVKTKHSLD